MKNYSALRPPARRLKSRATESEARLRGLDPAIPDYLLKLHQRLIVAIDRSTESQRQRIQRAQGWRSRWEAMPHPPATHTIFLWLTTGGSERLDTIWEAWIGHAFLPAFFAARRALDADVPRWRPWEPLRFDQGRYRWRWRDRSGRPRSLKPWEMHEPVWRTEALRPVTLPSLTASIAAWDRVCPAPGG